MTRAAWGAGSLPVRASEHLTGSKRFDRAFSVTLARRWLEFGALAAVGAAALVDA